jgi:hypothetical protein
VKIFVLRWVLIREDKGFRESIFCSATASYEEHKYRKQVTVSEDACYVDTAEMHLNVVMMCKTTTGESHEPFMAMDAWQALTNHDHDPIPEYHHTPPEMLHVQGSFMRIYRYCLDRQ